MLKKIKMTLLSFSALFMFAMPLAFAGVASAVDLDPGGQACKGSGLTFTGGAGDKSSCTKASGDLGKLVAKIINIVSVIVGAVAVVMIIVGGFRYVTSGGKDESVKGAKNTILYALIGLVIVALAQIIVRFVIDRSNPTGT